MIYLVAIVAVLTGGLLGSVGTAIYLLVREDKYDALVRKLSGG